MSEIFNYSGDKLGNLICSTTFHSNISINILAKYKQKYETDHLVQCQKVLKANIISSLIEERY